MCLSENEFSKVDTSDLGPTEATQEGGPELGVDEEHKIIDGAKEQPVGLTRDNSEMNLGSPNDAAQANGDGAGKKKGTLVGNSDHLTANCFAKVEFQRESLQVKSKKGLCMAVKRQL